MLALCQTIEQCDFFFFTMESLYYYIYMDKYHRTGLNRKFRGGGIIQHLIRKLQQQKKFLDMIVNDS